MRTKEVEEAIKEGKDYIEFMTTAGDNAEWAETILAYIEELEKIPNKIKDKIKELKDELKSIQDKLSKNMLFSESEFYSFSEYTKWRIEINQKIKDIDAKIAVLKELLGE